MKKSICVLAALVSAPCYAQATVSGIVDFAYASVAGSGTTAATKRQTVDQTTGTATTSMLNFSVVEKIGNITAEGAYFFDPRNITTGAAGAGNASGTFAAHQAFVGLSGGFGSVKLGRMNAGVLQAFLASSPLGTGIGSAFTLTDHEAVVSVGTVRYNQSLRYDSPNVSGFSGSLTYAPGNDDTTAGGAARPAITNFALSYSAGPLNVVVSSLQVGATTGQGAIDRVKKGSYTSIGANFQLGATRLFAGYGDGDKATAGGLDTRNSRLGISHTMAPITLIGQYTTAKIGTAAEREVLGLRADYALSKRTVSYVGYESYDNGAASANKTNTLAVGVRHNF